MVSLPGDRASARVETRPDSPDLESDLGAQVDPEIVFRMIDGLLPFEACLYHQLLPLALEGSRLKLGMVNPGDTTALDYVRRILSYMNCSLVPEHIPAETHQRILSAYLNYSGQKKKRKLQAEAKSSAEQDPERSSNSANQPKATFIVDNPDELANAADDRVALSSQQHGGEPTVIQPRSRNKQNTLILDADENSAENPADFLAEEYEIPLLEIHANHLFSPVDILATLPPKMLVHELLGRALVGGIGRLYLERQVDRGRVLWSQNGVLQSIVPDLDFPTFQGLINELKRFVQLPLIPVKQSKQVEVERLYNEERLMLRLRVMPGEHGEEATLQVLRGAALKFHQQQQLANLGRDALNIAQQLQLKLTEIRDRTRSDPHLSGSQLEALPALDQLIKHAESQLNALKALKSTQGTSEADAD